MIEATLDAVSTVATLHLTGDVPPVITRRVRDAYAALCHAVARERRPEVVIGGSGREAAQLREQARRLPVRSVGFQRDPAAFLANVDAFCLPSRWEALPMALLEAMSASLACVASNVGDIQAAARPAICSVPPEDPHASVRSVEVDAGLFTWTGGEYRRDVVGGIGKIDLHAS